jgi:hypothetical protein
METIPFTWIPFHSLHSSHYYEPVLLYLHPPATTVVAKSLKSAVAVLQPNNLLGTIWIKPPEKQTRKNQDALTKYNI